MKKISKIKKKLIKANIESKHPAKSLGYLVCAERMVNYGKINLGDTIKQDFVLVNKGKEDVRILSYKASCNCTSTSLEKKIIPPNDSTVFKMIIETQNKNKGLNEVTTTIETNGKRKFTLLLTRFEIIE